MFPSLIFYLQVVEGARCVWADSTRENLVINTSDDSFSLQPTTIKTKSKTKIKTDSNLSENIEKNAFPYVSVEIRKKMMRIFDSQVAFCEVSILPLLLYPNIPIERIFCLTDTGTGTPSGMISLKLLFMPMKGAIIPPSISMKLPIESFSGNFDDSDEARNILGSGGDRHGSSINIRPEQFEKGSNILSIDDGTKYLCSNQIKNEQQVKQQQLSTHLEESKEISKEQKYMRLIQDRMLDSKNKEKVLPSLTSEVIDVIPPYKSGTSSVSTSKLPSGLCDNRKEQTSADATSLSPAISTITSAAHRNDDNVDVSTLHTLIPNIISRSSNNSIGCSISSCSSSNVSYNNLLSQELRFPKPIPVRENNQKNSNFQDGKNHSSSSSSSSSGSGSSSGSNSASSGSSRTLKNSDSSNSTKISKNDRNSRTYEPFAVNDLMTLAEPQLAYEKNLLSLEQPSANSFNLPTAQLKNLVTTLPMPSSSPSAVPKLFLSNNIGSTFRHIPSNLSDNISQIEKSTPSDLKNNATNGSSMKDRNHDSNYSKYDSSGRERSVSNSSPSPKSTSISSFQNNYAGTRKSNVAGEKVGKTSQNGDKVKNRGERIVEHRNAERNDNEEMHVNASVGKKGAEIDIDVHADQFRDLSSLRQRRNSLLSSGKPGSSRRPSVDSSNSSKRSINRLDRKDFRAENKVLKGGKEGYEGKKGKSSLLDPVTPSGMADWFLVAGHGVVQYLGKQLMDNDDSNKDLSLSYSSENINTNMNINGNTNTTINQSNKSNKSSISHVNGLQSKLYKETNKSSYDNGAASYQRMEGVGRIHVNLVSAFKSLVTDAAEGDHYVVRTNSV